MSATQSTTVPQLTTDRLILRDFYESDVHAVYEIFSDDRVTEFYDLETFSCFEQARQLVVSRMHGNVEPNSGSSRWAICLVDDPGHVIGSCGFHSANQTFHSIEIGYDLHAAFWGRGYAFEALVAMLVFRFASDVPFPVNRVAATTNLDSQRSMKLLQRLGFKEEGVLRQYGFWKGQFHDVRLFSMVRGDWDTRSV